MSKKKAIPTAHVPKDSLIQIIRDIAGYVVTPRASDSGLGHVLAPWLEKYKIAYRGQYHNDTSMYVFINSTYADPEAKGDEMVVVGSENKDSIVWLTESDLTKAFGAHEKGILDHSMPLHKEPGWYTIYTLNTPTSVPAYICVHGYMSAEKPIVWALEIKKRFYFLKNK